MGTSRNPQGTSPCQKHPTLFDYPLFAGANMFYRYAAYLQPGQRHIHESLGDRGQCKTN